MKNTSPEYGGEMSLQRDLERFMKGSMHMYLMYCELFSVK